PHSHFAGGGAGGGGSGWEVCADGGSGLPLEDEDDDDCGGLAFGAPAVPPELASGTPSTAPPHPPLVPTVASAEPAAMAMKNRERRLDRRVARMRGPEAIGVHTGSPWNRVRTTCRSEPTMRYPRQRWRRFRGGAG